MFVWMWILMTVLFPHVGAQGILGGDDNTGGGGNVKPACIHGGDQVITPIGIRRIDQLKIGDHVSVDHSKFEPIIAFLHQDSSRNTTGFRFSTSSGVNLTISDRHLLFIAPNRKSVLARNVQIGDRIYLVQNGSYVEDMITKIERTEVLGRYNPVTPSGILLVNNILVSCYSEMDHYLTHRIFNELLTYGLWRNIVWMESIVGRNEGIYWVVDALWHNFRHWFLAGSSLYEAAALAGFRYVECCFPYDVPAETIAKKCQELKLENVLINTPLCTGPGESKGVACLSDKKPLFCDSLKMAIDYAKAINCTRIHIMAGVEPEGTDHKVLESTYLENLVYASRQLSEAGITGLIEPINSYTVPGYFLKNGDQALGYLDQLPSNIRLQLDIFHLQMSQGCLSKNIQRYLPYTGHIQVSQVPTRHEPWSSGEIDYGYIYDLLRSLNYDGYIGLEYMPANGTMAGLKGMKEAK